VVRCGPQGNTLEVRILPYRSVLNNKETTQMILPGHGERDEVQSLRQKKSVSVSLVWGTYLLKSSWIRGLGAE